MGVEEKKATRELQDKVKDEGVARLKKAIGATTLTVDVELDEGCTAAQIKTAASNIMGDFIDGVVKTCQDADYREEFAKIKKYVIQVVPTIDESDKGIYGTITMKDKVMMVRLDGSHMMNGNDSDAIPKVFKKLL